jgi:hypothetical protein
VSWRNNVWWLAGLLLWGGAAWAGEGTVAAVVTMQGDRVASLSLTLPGRQSREQMLLELQQVSQWTGWELAESDLKATDRDTSVQVAVTDGGQLSGSLSDMVWPLIAALADHQRVGILVFGGPATASGLKFVNRFVSWEQTSTQGIASYQVEVKDKSFRSLEELRQVESRPAAATRRTSPKGSRAALAWLLLIIASAACGVTAYLLVRSGGQRSNRVRRPRRR